MFSDEPLTMLMAHKQQAWLFRHNCRKAAPAVVKCGGNEPFQTLKRF